MLVKQLKGLNGPLRRYFSKIAAERLSGKVAVTTASTEGIGYAIAERLCGEGADVVVSSRRAGNVERAVAQLKEKGYERVLGVQCNVNKEQDRLALVRETMERFGGIDLFVSNAAVNPAMGGVLDCAEAVWDKIFDVNLKSALLLTQLVAPHLQERGGGSIVYVSSIGAYNSIPMLGAYSVSKTALLGLTKAVAQELGPHGVRANCVAPGVIMTKFSKPLHSNEAVASQILQQVPLNRFGATEEVASVVAFLLSEDASYITGENLPVAGGMPSRL